MFCLRSIVLLPILLLVGVLPAHAADCSLTFPGEWTNPAIWSCGVVPGAGDHAIVVGGSLSVTVSSPQTVGSLTYNGSSLNVSAQLTVTSTFTWQGGFIIGGNGAAVVLDAGSTSTRTGGVLHTDAILENRGTMTYTGTLPNGSGRFDNGSTGLLVLAGTAASERIVNSGTVRKTTAATFSQTQRIESTGTIDVQAGTMVLGLGPHSIAGPVTVAAGAALQQTGSGTSTSYTAGASISGAGALVISNTQNVNADVTWSVASVTLSGGTLISGLGNLTITGTFAWTGGFIVGGNNHKVILSTTTTSTRTGGTLHTDAILENRGTMTCTGALPSGSGRFDNGSTGLLVLAGTLASDRIVNGGTIRKTTAATLTQTGRVESTGTIDVQAGTLILNGGANTAAGTLNIGAGTVLRIGNSSTLLAGLAFTGTGVLELASTVQVLAAYAHAGLTRVVAGQAVFDNAASVTFAALTHSAGFLDIQRPAATITGTFTRTGGRLRTTGNTLTFAGVGLQLLDLSVASTFANLAVAPGTTLVEVQAANNATVTSTLINLGVIRKTRTMAAGSNVFGLTGVTLSAATLGSLTTVQIDRRDVTHPSAGPDQQTGRYWTMTPVGTGFDLSVTLPHAIASHQSTTACRFTGASWDCDRTTSAAGQVTRAGVGTGDSGHSITGTVRDLNNTGVANVTMELTGTATRSTTTDADGRYAFTGLAPGGTYTVAPTQLSFVFTPASQTFTNVTSNQEAAFFLAELGTFTRYFAEGATSDFFETEIALLNATGEATTASLTFLKGDGTSASHDILIANTSSTGGTAQVTLVFEDGTTAVRTIPLLPNSRESVPVSIFFPEAAGRRFGVVVESFGAPAPDIVVERAMYGDAAGVTWAAGSNVVGTRLR